MPTVVVGARGAASLELAMAKGLYSACGKSQSGNAGRGGWWRGLTVVFDRARIAKGPI